MFPSSLLEKTTGLGLLSGSAGAQDAHAGEPRGLLLALSPQLLEAVLGTEGEHPGYTLPGVAGVKACGKGDFRAPQLHQPSWDARCRRAGGGGGREQGTNSRSNGEGRGRKRRWQGGEEGCPPLEQRIALYPPSFPPSHTPTTEAASHQDIYEHTHKWEAEGRKKKTKHQQNTPPATTTQPYFAHSLSSKSRCAVACKPRRTLPCC